MASVGATLVVALLPPFALSLSKGIINCVAPAEAGAPTNATPLPLPPTSFAPGAPSATVSP